MTTLRQVSRAGKSCLFVVHLTLLCLLFGSTASTADSGNLEFAEFEECTLENGQGIAPCRVGYRRWGRLNKDQSNIVLMPTWYNGSAEALATYGYLGPGKIVDTDRYHVIAVNAFGNGISSSPSNHPLAPGDTFPEFSIRDLVTTQHRLLTEKLGIERLHAVVGVSLGGYQVFEWMMQFPEFAKHFVPIEGTPWPTHYDQLLWTAWQKILEAPLEQPVDIERATDLLTAADGLTLWSPEYINRINSATPFTTYFKSIRKKPGQAYLLDRASQTKALFTHDIRAPYPDFKAHIESISQQSVLAVVFESDMMVNPGPSRELADMMGFEVFQVPGDCGHMGPEAECYQGVVARRVQQFLAQESKTAGNTERHVMTHDGIEREYFVYRPVGVTPQAKLPVLLALHGYGTTATGFEAIYQLNRHAQAHGYMVVYPQGSDFMGAFGDDPGAEKFLITTWNDEVTNFTPGPSGEPHCTDDRLAYPCPPECGSCNHCAWVSCYDDFGFLNRVLDSVQNQYNTDPERHYLLGSSNGGTLAMRLVCQMPARFAAIAVNLIQMPPGFACAPDRSVPLMHLYGKKDDNTGYDGTATNDGWIFTTAAETAEKWAAALGCAATPSPWQNNISMANGLHCKVWNNCRVEGHKVLSCMDPEAGHEWRAQRLTDIPAECVSPAQQASLPGQPPCPQPDPDAMAQLRGMDLTWQFLSQYRRAESR
jgi:homoserine O-acetyltransferase